LANNQNNKGKTILEKRRFFRENYDHIRTGLMWEPRGHADQYGTILTEATTPDGDLGVFFLHNEGLDTPAGRVVATAHRVNGVVRSVSFVNVPSFVYKLNQKIEVAGIGTVEYDIAFGGAFYAFCDADKLGIVLTKKI